MEKKTLSKVTVNYPIFFKNKQQSVTFNTEITRKINFVSFSLPLPLNVFTKNGKRHLHEKENVIIFEFRSIDEAKSFIDDADCFIKLAESKKIALVSTNKFGGAFDRSLK
ncbi:hypothetical protein CDIK_0269 [Cucumispora dikerogammari]|nr:hypothetical protein CDIK_0269 [Cucumispora dikerogammari]